MGRRETGGGEGEGEGEGWRDRYDHHVHTGGQYIVLSCIVIVYALVRLSSVAREGRGKKRRDTAMNIKDTS